MLFMVVGCQASRFPAAESSRRSDGGMYRVGDAKINIHCTGGYPRLWQGLYRETLEH